MLAQFTIESFFSNFLSWPLVLSYLFIRDYTPIEHDNIHKRGVSRFQAQFEPRKWPSKNSGFRTGMINIVHYVILLQSHWPIYVNKPVSFYLLHLRFLRKLLKKSISNFELIFFLE